MRRPPPRLFLRRRRRKTTTSAATSLAHHGILLRAPPPPNDHQTTTTAAAAATSASTTTAPSTTPAPIPVNSLPSSTEGATATYGSFLECLQHAPEDKYSVVRALMPRYLTTSAKAWANPDLQLTVFVPSDAAFEKFWRLSLKDMSSFPIEHFRTAFTPFIKYSIVPKSLAPEEMTVGLTEPTWFAKQKAGADLRFVPGKAGGARDSVAVRARYSLAPLTSDHWRCGQGWAHGVDSLLLF
jgi:hypothetical protein